MSVNNEYRPISLIDNNLQVYSLFTFLIILFDYIFSE